MLALRLLWTANQAHHTKSSSFHFPRDHSIKIATSKLEDQKQGRTLADAHEAHTAIDSCLTFCGRVDKILEMLADVDTRYSSVQVVGGGRGGRVGGSRSRYSTVNEEERSTGKRRSWNGRVVQVGPGAS